MEPLVTMRKALTWFCVFPVPEGAGKHKKIIYITSSLVIFGTIMFQVGASAAFVRKFSTIDFEKSVSGLHPVMGWTPLLCVFGIIIFLKHIIVEIFNALAEFYNKYADKESFRYLAQANDKSEIFWEKYLKYVVFGFGASTLFSCLSSVLELVLSGEDFDTEKLYLQFDLLLPWNQSTPMGYAGESIYSIFACQIYLIFNGVILVLYMSLCLHHEALYRMQRYFVGNLENHEFNSFNDKEALCELIDCHCFAKSWFDATSKVLNPIALMFLTFFILALACIVYELDLELQHPSSEIIYHLFATAIATANLYVYCYCGNFATESFRNMGDCFYGANWYNYPIEFQKYFSIMIVNGKKSVFYHGYGVFILNLETFSQLIKSVFTYYMALKTIFVNFKNIL